MVDEISIELSEVKKALQIVSALMDNLSIRGDRAAKWAITLEILADLETFVDNSIQAVQKDESLQENAASVDEMEETDTASPEGEPEPSAEV